MYTVNQRSIWKDQFPADAYRISGANDVPVGVGRTLDNPYVGGTRWVDLTVDRSFFCVTKYSLASSSPQLADTIIWPPPDDDITESAIATAMSYWGDNSGTVKIYLTGTLVDYSGYKRPATICVDNGGASGALQVCWTAAEALDIAGDAIPVAITHCVNSQGNPDEVAVVVQTPSNILVQVYNASNGSSAMPARWWTDVGSGSATAVGIGFVDTSYFGTTAGRGVVVGATAPHPTHTGTNAITLFGWETKTITNGPSSGAAMGGSPVRISKTSSDSDSARAMTSWASEIGDGFSAVTGLRENGSAKDWITARIVASGNGSAANNLVVAWAETLDNNSGNADIANAICIYSSSIGDEAVNHLRVGVAGTTKAGSGDTDVLVAGYLAEAQQAPTPQREWKEDKDNDIEGYFSNDEPLAVTVGHFSGLSGTNIRMYVTGRTEKSGANQDMLAMAFDARSQASASNPRFLWTDAFFRTSPATDGEDVGVAAVGGLMVPPNFQTNGLFMTGWTVDSTYAKDWWTHRVDP